MNEELSKKEATNTVKDKDSKRKTVVFGIVFVFAVLFVVILILTLFKEEKEEKKPSNSNNNNIENHYNYDYKYVLQTDFGADYFIYLLNDDSVKVVGKIPRAEICEGTNCMQFTGEYDYEETTIEFSDKSMEKVREFISSFFEKKLTNYLDLEKVELTKEQQIIELALLLNHEDMITFEDDLIYDAKTQQLKNSAGKTIFEMSKTTIVSSNNEIVNNIGTYLNALVEADWNLLDAEIKQVMADGFAFTGNDKIDFNLTLEDRSAFTVSFTYSMGGSFGELVRGDKKGFVFNSANGEIKEYPGGWKDKEKVLEEFKKLEEYKNMQDNLMPNWETILTETIYTSGYWYLKDDKIIFLIPESLISDSPLRGHVIELEIENTHGDF